MKSSNVKFNTKNQAEFIGVLRRRVNQYFKDNNISKYGNLNMKLKTVFMLCLYFIPFILMLVYVTTPWIIMLLWVLMAFGMSGIGLSIMHDANHNAYSINKNVNKIMGFLINFLGGFHENWKLQHNVLHHTYTNIDGLDEDIDSPLLRMSPNQEIKKIHKYQIIYAPFIYGLMTIFWITTKDFTQLIRYKNKNLLESRGLNYRSLMNQIIFHKVWYLALMLFLPIFILDLPWWQTLLGFLLMHYISGLFLALVFQTAHVIKETNFPLLNEKGNVDNNRAVHQLYTTANFANNSVLFSWFIGGLNFQVEHHLFPNICHVHYKKISKIIKQTSKEYGLPYYEHKTFYGALKSHFSLIAQLGKGKTKLDSVIY